VLTCPSRSLSSPRSAGPHRFERPVVNTRVNRVTTGPFDQKGSEPWQSLRSIDGSVSCGRFGTNWRRWSGRAGGRWSSTRWLILTVLVVGLFVFGLDVLFSRVVVEMFDE
jgi:hypothetical protein